MKFTTLNPPRKFRVGKGSKIEMSDTGSIFLQHDEQVTFKTTDNKEYDVARKSWGFYATPSLAGRLKSFNLRPALMRNSSGQCYVILVETDKIKELEQYLIDEDQEIVIWLDEFEFLQSLKPLGKTASPQSQKSN